MNTYVLKKLQHTFKYPIKIIKQSILGISIYHLQFYYLIIKISIQFNYILNILYKEQTIIELPILKLISQFYQSENSPIKIDDYLFIAFTVLQTGEMIYPDRYVGEFLKYQGESIIQDIQKNASDYSHMQIIDEIIKMAEYDEELYFND